MPEEQKKDEQAAPQGQAMPQVDPDFQKRSEEFIKGYGELVQKHKVDIAAYPVYMPTGEADGSFKTIIQQSTVDTKDQPYRSTFMEEEGAK